MTHPLLPEAGFVRLSPVLQIVPLSKSTWRAGVKSGRFPQPITLGERSIAWRVEDIRRFIESDGKYQSHATSD